MPDETNETPQTPETPAALEIDGIVVELAPDAEAPPVAVVTTNETPAVPAPPETPATPATPATSALPEWLSAIPEEQRVEAASAFLEQLTEAQRLQLPAVMAIANGAYSAGTQQTEQRITEQLNDDSRQAELLQSANSLHDDIMNARVESSDALTTRIADLAEVGGDTRQAELNDDIQTSIYTQARLLGLAQIPGEIAAAAANADGWGGALDEYNRFFLVTAYNKGKDDQKALSGTAANGGTAIDKARLRDEIIAELRTEGRIKDDVPPVLGDGTPTSSGGLSPAEYKRKLDAGEELTAEQIDAMTRSFVSL